MAFIAFEGGEGTGKSTQLKLTLEWLRLKGFPVFETREPGGSPLAEKVRTLFKEIPEHGDAPTPLTELMLVMASRAQHLEKTILPRLAKNEWVLCDRFLDSTYIYQGVVGKLDKKQIDTIGAMVLRDLVPDFTLVFSVPPDIAAQRRHARNQGQDMRDRLDEVHDLVHNKIDEGFRDLVEKNIPYPNGKVPQRVLISSAGTPEAVQTEVRKAVAQRFGI